MKPSEHLKPSTHLRNIVDGLIRDAPWIDHVSLHMAESLLRQRLHGSRGHRKLSDADVEQIRERAAKGERQVDLANEFGVSRSYICQIVRLTTRAPIV